ncbi:hypothetical protein HYV50_02925 [Candidatus Pacearchaeota archaeon]|nr:hypothetical protein [Candidatus Pacearchaeota archaeon]
MTSEYVRVSASEKAFGHTGLLNGQLELLDIMKKVRNYRTVRNEELMLKIVLKAKIGELLEAIEKLEKTLPESYFKAEVPKAKKERMSAENRKELEELGLQGEIDEIRRKLDRLQSGRW